MLLEVHRDRYREFQQALEQLQGMATAAAAVGGTADAAALSDGLSEALFEVQQFFGREILGWSPQDVYPEMASRIQSCHTEMHKQLRLLATDLMFLRSARSPDTLRARQIQVSDRLKTLIGYCSALLEE